MAIPIMRARKTKPHWFEDACKITVFVSCVPTWTLCTVAGAWAHDMCDTGCTPNLSTITLPRRVSTDKMLFRADCVSPAALCSPESMCTHQSARSRGRDTVLSWESANYCWWTGRRRLCRVWLVVRAKRCERRHAQALEPGWIKRGSARDRLGAAPLSDNCSAVKVLQTTRVQYFVTRETTPYS